MHVPVIPEPLGVLAVVQNISISVFVAWTWDGILSFGDDVKLFKDYKFSLAHMIYLLARATMLCFLTFNMVFIVFPGGCIPHLTGVVAWLNMTTVPFNSLLFVIRIRAVFRGEILIQAFFFTFWLVVLASALTQPFCITWAWVSAKFNCAPTLSQPYCISSSVGMMAHDTLVFFAISAKLVAHHWMPLASRSQKFRAFFSGKGLPQISKLLLQTGQLYYFITVLVNIGTIVVVLTPSIPDWYKALNLVHSSAISNFIACRVYREVKLGAMNNGSNDDSNPLRPIHKDEVSTMLFRVAANPPPTDESLL
ncbi:hypothetical protein NLI96_g3638 [Meripilus lineatus]|uniref:Uncharacterized protein n=1 Tax=Meripilus lineatus TaxID=2056292 RepID=A0AAD5V6D4_9APHY|nr:hypothetical protein NLI96_g3638 [Physisporinus lineatus]